MNTPSRPSVLPVVVSLSLVLLLILVLLLVLPARQAVSPSQSWQFFADRKSSFFSVRSFDRYAGDLLELRNIAFPLMGGLNRFLFALEYVVDHELTKTDLNEFLGRDFTLQLGPKFLLVTRTRKEYNVFMYLDIKDDPVVPWGRAVVRRKVLKPLGTTLYYSFLQDYLVVADDLGTLKSFLKRGFKPAARRRWPSAVREGLDGASFIAGHSGGRGPFALLFGARPWLLFGPALNSLKLFARDGSQDTDFDRGSVVFFNIDPSVVGPAGRPSVAKVMVRDFRFRQKSLSMGYSVLLPRDAPPRQLAAVRRTVSEMLNPGGAECLAYPFGDWIALSDSPEQAPLERTGCVFFADTVRLASLGLFPPELEGLLTEMQSVSVRVLQ